VSRWLVRGDAAAVVVEVVVAGAVEDDSTCDEAQQPDDLEVDVADVAVEVGWAPYGDDDAVIVVVVVVPFVVPYAVQAACCWFEWSQLKMPNVALSAEKMKKDAKSGVKSWLSMVSVQRDLEDEDDWEQAESQLEVMTVEESAIVVHGSLVPWLELQQTTREICEMVLDVVDAAGVADVA
jgi:hypothetical protein